MVTAREAIVLATNSPFTHNVAVHARQEAWRTYMLVCAIPKGECGLCGRLEGPRRDDERVADSKRYLATTAGAVERAQWWTAEEIYRYVSDDARCVCCARDRCSVYDTHARP